MLRLPWLSISHGTSLRKHVGRKSHLKHGLVVRADLDVVPAAQSDDKALVDPGPQLLGLLSCGRGIVNRRGHGSWRSRREIAGAAPSGKVSHLGFLCDCVSAAIDQIAPMSARHCCATFMRSAIWRGSRQSILSANTVCSLPFPTQAHQPAQRRLAEFGAQQAGLGADDAVADLGDGQDIAHQFLAAF